MTSSFSIAGAAVLVLGSATTAFAGGAFTGTWQPYIKTAIFLSTMSVSSSELRFEDGGGAKLEAVRPGGSVFRVASVFGDGWTSCGDKPDTFVGFHVMENGLLAFLEYDTGAPPAEPSGTSSFDMMDEGACVVSFFSR